MFALLCIGTFVLTYVINMTWMSVFYHRGLAHGAVEMRPGVRRFIAWSGTWVTGLDPKAWVCMHRLHHAHSDTPRDPHSPTNVGIFGVLIAQLRSYERVMAGLIGDRPAMTSLVSDLDFPVDWVHRHRLWFLPFAVHAVIAILLSVAAGSLLLGACYYAGLMSHPIQGWLVNSFGHAVGGRNFTTDDDSRNNHVVAWLVFGEGLQNNHHAYPRSARFSARRGEVDPGYQVCRLLERFRVLRIRRDQLIDRSDLHDTRAAA